MKKELIYRFGAQSHGLANLALLEWMALNKRGGGVNCSKRVFANF